MIALSTPCQFIKKIFPDVLEVIRKEGRTKRVLTPRQVAMISHLYGVDEESVIRGEPILSEVGVAFCEDVHGNVYPAGICRGAGCSVKILGTSDRIVGTIHTHPTRGRLHPSQIDLRTEIFHNMSEWFGIISIYSRDMIFLWNFDEYRVRGNRLYISVSLGELRDDYGIQFCRGKY